jgi:hypothetical protein
VISYVALSISISGRKVVILETWLSKSNRNVPESVATDSSQPENKNAAIIQAIPHRRTKRTFILPSNFTLHEVQMVKTQVLTEE